MKRLEPRSPAELNPLAAEVLNSLKGQPAAAPIIIGGGVALQHYCPYRPTRDLDAWWRDRANVETEALLDDVLKTLADQHGFSYERRAFGDTQSYELAQTGTKVFTVQIAVRSVTLDQPWPTDWNPVAIETFRDNLGAKMNAIDSSLYPDCEPPRRLVTDEEKADYLQRVCGAFDYGLPPTIDALRMLRDWKPIFDRFPLRGSPAYHALRTFYEWDPVPRLPFLIKPHYQVLDELEGRSDGCEHLV